MRNSDRYWNLELQLTQKATRSAEQFLARHETQRVASGIREALRQPIVEAKPGTFGFSVNLLGLRDWWRRWRRERRGGRDSADVEVIVVAAFSSLVVHEIACRRGQGSPLARSRSHR